MVASSLPTQMAVPRRVRRFRDLVIEHKSDLAGADNVSSSERRLIYRAAMLTVQLEMMDAKFAQSEDCAPSRDLESYQRATNTLRRTLESLGLRRRSKVINPPSLSTYLREQAAEAAE